jgi:hypothetical protein
MIEKIKKPRQQDPILFFRHMPPINGGATVKDKKPSLKLDFSLCTTMYRLDEDRGRIYTCSRECHVQSIF